MTIYFIKNPITNTVKIGWANSANMKLQQLSEACGIDLILLGVLHDDKKRLDELKNIDFTESNYMGDWFNITPKLEEFLRDLTEQPKNDQMVRVRWGTYQLLVKHKQSTFIPIVRIVELAIEEFFRNHSDDKPTVYPSFYGGNAQDDERKY